MSFNGGWQPPWHNQASKPDSWRPYANNQGGGPIRQPPPPQAQRSNGWLNVLANPYFSRNVGAQSHVTNYERNRMNVFSQPQPVVQKPLISQAPPPVNPMSEFVRQTLMKNTHVPGLRTGLQMRDAIKKRAKAREIPAEKRANVATIPVQFSVFSEKIELRWQQPTARKDIKFLITSTHTKTKKMTSFDPQPSTSKNYELQVTAGDIYKIEIKCISTDKDFLVAIWSKEIRAEFSYSELKRLLQKCYQFVQRGIPNAEPLMHEFCVVYRCKPKVYWDEIHHCCNDVMQKYIKDDNGQPGNLINGKINGLFFSARLLPDLTLPQFSPFGNVRMVINCFVILNPERHNFYFADFYCNKNIHYVTVVICLVNSETDLYCREKLVKLNPLSNPFVKLVPPVVDQFGQWRFYVNYTLWVELYYTEDIQLDMGQFSAIMATGAGTSRIGGLPNNKQCTMCNLYPIGKKKLPVAPVVEAASVKNVDSTMTTILREGCGHVDSEVADTLAYLIDRVEERSLTAQELAEKLDPELVKAVDHMNKAVAREKNASMTSIFRNLNDFVTGFNKRRDALFEEIKKLKN